MGDPVLADDLIPLLMLSSDSCRNARQMLALRQNAVIIYIQRLFLPIQLSMTFFKLLTENGRKNTAEKQLPSWLRSAATIFPKVT
jgi:hypothetical protein